MWSKPRGGTRSVLQGGGSSVSEGGVALSSRGGSDGIRDENSQALDTTAGWALPWIQATQSMFSDPVVKVTQDSVVLDTGRM